MLKLSKLTDYAIVVLVHLREDAPVRTASSVAQAVGLPEPTVSKVLKTLAGAGLVSSQRGARGGYGLARPLASIGVADVVVAMDGPVALVACVEGSTAPCEAENACPVRGRWDPINDAVRKALAHITLADIEAAQPKPLRDLNRSPRQPFASAGAAHHPDTVSS